MKKIVIIKTGETFPELLPSSGDFEDFIMRELAAGSPEFVVVAAYKKERLPDFADVSAVIITGSHAMVSEHDDWSVALAAWLRDTAPYHIPVLGICYGHQLLAEAFGGRVGYHPGGREIGTVPIRLTEEGRKDRLLMSMPDAFWGHVMHEQTVLELPATATVLAANDFEKHHAFVIHDCIWGVQFHPEFTADIMHFYVERQKADLERAGLNVQQLHQSVKQHEYGQILLKQFLTVVSS